MDKYSLFKQSTLKIKKIVLNKERKIQYIYIYTHTHIQLSFGVINWYAYLLGFVIIMPFYLQQHF